jgi:hypothetical protein
MTIMMIRMMTHVAMMMSTVLEIIPTLLLIHLIGLVINYREWRGHSGNMQYQQVQVGEYQLRFALYCRMLLNDMNQIKSDDRWMDGWMDPNKIEQRTRRLD